MIELEDRPPAGGAADKYGVREKRSCYVDTTVFYILKKKGL